MPGGGNVRFKVRNTCSDFDSYRAARVKSLFNVETGCNFSLDVDIDLAGAWSIGVIVGPSGSGKTSLGRQLFGGGKLYEATGWDSSKPIVDCIAPGGDFNAVTGALAAVGLGSVPTWLRPYAVLSNGERFRADLARIISEAPAEVVVDEFTSVVDRRIAKFGALAFAKSWRRTGGRCVLLSCHYDILDWVEPDWVFDTQSGEFQRGALWRRPTFDVEIRQTSQDYWPLFEPHYYLTLPRMVASDSYVGVVDDEPVCHLAVAPAFQLQDAVRASRMVVMPEWQGAGIGLRFLDAVLDLYLEGLSRYGARPRSGLFHTTHPGLCAGLRRSARWRQTSAALHGANKKASRRSIIKSQISAGQNSILSTGYGGHFRAIQGFRYYGKATA